MKKKVFALTALLLLSLAVQAAAASADFPLTGPVRDAGSDPALDPANWKLGANWTMDNQGGTMIFYSDTSTDGILWFENEQLAGAWQIRFSVEMLTTPDSESSVKILVGSNGKASKYNILITRHPAGLNSVSVMLNTGITLLRSGWITGGDRAFDITITHPAADARNLILNIVGNNTFRYTETTPVMFDANKPVKGFGIQGTDFDLLVRDLSVNGAYAQDGRYTAYARTGIGDMISNYWTKGPGEGHILPTWCGYPSENLPDSRGMLWERAMMVLPMYSFYRVTGDALIRKRLTAEWDFIRSSYTDEELCAAGSGLHPAVDDSGWAAMMYTALYAVTGDSRALRAAQSMVDNAMARWLDDEMGGGLWYKDERRFKSVYQCGIVTAALNIYELTGDEGYRDKFRTLYEWIETGLRRDDGLYWVNRLPGGPEGAGNPDAIRETSSVTCLMGNMAMASINARLFKMTGDDAYRQLALATAEGIYQKERSTKGIYLDDRDAWANGTFAADWAINVLTLPGADEKYRDCLYATGDSIAANARTPMGFYGGSWDGPAEGIGSAWFCAGSRAQQIMTSGSTVNMLVAAAAAEIYGGK